MNIFSLSWLPTAETYASKSNIKNLFHNKFNYRSNVDIDFNTNLF